MIPLVNLPCRTLFYSLLGTLLIVFSTSATATELTLIYSGNLDGELEPCGCSESGDLGGLRRRATLLESMRQQHPQSVVISSGGILSAQMTSNTLKNRYILEAMSALNYDAIGLQWTDLAYGMQALNASPLPWVASNWIGEKFPADLRIERAGLNLTVFQWLDPASSPYRQMGEANARVEKNTQILVDRLNAARNRGDTTVLGTTLSLEQAMATLPLQLIDLLLIEAAYEHLGKPQQIGQTLVIQPGSRGMRLGKLDMDINPQGRIVQWDHQELPMPPEVANAPSMEMWYQRYNEDTKLFYQQRVAQRKASQEGQSPFVGAKQCQLCHAKSYQIWQHSEHAKAMADLQAVEKSYDPECLACHTVGLGTEGGYLDQFSTPQLANVQCENCHGAGRQHAESGGQSAISSNHQKPDQSTCLGCHNSSHSPEFNFEHYWPQIHHQKE